MNRRAHRQCEIERRTQNNWLSVCIVLFNSLGSLLPKLHTYTNTDTAAAPTLSRVHHTVQPPPYWRASSIIETASAGGLAGGSHTQLAGPLAILPPSISLLCINYVCMCIIQFSHKQTHHLNGGSGGV